MEFSVPFFTSAYCSDIIVLESSLSRDITWAQGLLCYSSLYLHIKNKLTLCFISMFPPIFSLLEKFVEIFHPSYALISDFCLGLIMFTIFFSVVLWEFHMGKHGSVFSISHIKPDLCNFEICGKDIFVVQQKVIRISNCKMG